MEMPNIVVPCLRLPFSHTSRFTQLVTGEDFAHKSMLSFNQTSLLKAHPLRHTFLINGAKTLAVEGESPMHFESHVNSVCSKVRFERGYHLSIKGEPVHLPLPFPRIFTEKQFTENGLLKEKEDRQKDDFVLSVPVMTRIAQDGSYAGQVQNAYLKLKGMRPALRIQLLRDNNFLEEDELKEIIESLANTVEDFRMISVGDESDGSEDEDEEY